MSFCRKSFFLKITINLHIRIKLQFQNGKLWVSSVTPSTAITTQRSQFRCNFSRFHALCEQSNWVMSPTVQSSLRRGLPETPSSPVTLNESLRKPVETAGRVWILTDAPLPSSAPAPAPSSPAARNSDRQHHLGNSTIGPAAPEYRRSLGSFQWKLLADYGRRELFRLFPDVPRASPLRARFGIQLFREFSRIVSVFFLKRSCDAGERVPVH